MLFSDYLDGNIVGVYVWLVLLSTSCNMMCSSDAQLMPCLSSFFLQTMNSNWCDGLDPSIGSDGNYSNQVCNNFVLTQMKISSSYLYLHLAYIIKVAQKNKRFIHRSVLLSLIIISFLYQYKISKASIISYLPSSLAVNHNEQLQVSSVHTRYFLLACIHY